jgi:hypothetical protein
MSTARPSTPSWLLPGPIRRLREHMRAIRQLAGETRDAVDASRHESGKALAALQANAAREAELLAGVESRLNAHSQALANLTARAADRDAQHEQLVEILRFVLARGPEAQARLRLLRETPDYELAFSETEPLVSVVIPTYANYELLRARALPSVLAQSYQNFEVVVVGDHAPDAAREAVESFDDPRLSYYNLPYRGPYPVQPAARWFVVGTPPFNEASHRASGRWLAPLDDDDAFRPRHLEQLLERARADRLELAYGQIEMKLPDGRSETLGSFPPQYGQFNLQAAIWHVGLSHIFQCHLSDAALGVANDWALVLRMMEAGVRMGFLEEVMVDYFPARSGGSSEGYWGSPSSDEK